MSWLGTLIMENIPTFASTIREKRRNWFAKIVTKIPMSMFLLTTGCSKED